MNEKDLQFLPLLPTPEENQALIADPDYREIAEMTIDYYKTVGFTPPWICYCVLLDGKKVGSAGYKGKPVDNKIEIAYSTQLQYQQQGIGTIICRKLVQLALNADPNIIITARTLPGYNYSTRILEKNNFQLLGTVLDKEDGNVWEWQYKGIQKIFDNSII